MESDDFSIKEKIDFIRESKKKIHKSSTLIVGFLQMLYSDEKDHERAIFDIKQNLLTIINELNTIGGFCDKSTRDLIKNLTDVGVWLRAHGSINYYKKNKTVIDYWTGKSIGLPLDYSSYPFGIEAGFEIHFDTFKGYIKGGYERSGFPGGRTGGIATAIIIFILIIWLIYNQ